MRLSIANISNKGYYLSRPEIYPNKKLIGFDDETLKLIDGWRRKQTPIPNFSDAVRELVALGLKGKR
jgi:hypothetical protein